MGKTPPPEDYSSILSPEELAAIARSTAPLEAEAIENMRLRTLDQHAEMSKWLLASLLAINSGGAIAAVNAIGRVPVMLPAMIFAGGLLCALASGYAIQQAAAAVQAPLSRIRGYWLAVADDGERDLKMEASNNKVLQKSLLIGRFAPYLGFISTGFFVAGTWSLSHAHPAVVHPSPAARQAPLPDGGNRQQPLGAKDRP